ncbi:MAG: hypothetical protein H0X69_17290, partial [Gemmatimonadales bacterium]|nr:hypothetical protein [Gemmatimonadales bacterium]
RTPWQILRDWQTSGDDRDRALWLEWVAAMRGHHSLRWSRGFRADLLPETEQTDEEIAQGDAGAEEEVLRIPGEDWDRVVSTPGALASLLDAAEEGGRVAVAWRVGEILAIELERRERGPGCIGLAEIEREAEAERGELTREAVQAGRLLAMKVRNVRTAREECGERFEGSVVPRVLTERVPQATARRIAYALGVMRRRREDELFELITNSTEEER